MSRHCTRSFRFIRFVCLFALFSGIALLPLFSAPAKAAATRIIFMHHSTGQGLINQGNVRPALTALGYEFWDHGYNGEGLTDNTGTALGINWAVPDDNTDPDGWQTIFSQPVTNPATNTFSHMLEYDVIIFKSCFPASDIQSEEQLADYQAYFATIRNVVDTQPNRLFIAFTTPPLVPAATTPEAAARARQWSEYLTSAEYLSGHPNLLVFDFFDLLAGTDNYLRAEYRGTDPGDSHPNELANSTVGPIFVDFIDHAIKNASAVSQFAGLYNPTNGGFYLRNANAAGPANTVFPYGPGGSGWKPLTGAWLGGIQDMIGLYNPITSVFYLRNANAAGPADSVFQFGPANAGWLPIIGDWDGDGTDTVGLYRPATSAFYLRNANAGGNADAVVAYGPPNGGWLPIVGDWNADGTDTIGLYNPMTSVFYLRNTNTGGNADVIFAFGPPNGGWLPIVGDWNGDRTDTVGLYNPATGVFYLRNSHAGGNADVLFAFGPGSAGWLPVIGHWIAGVSAAPAQITTPNVAPTFVPSRR
jgi:hypothetical protein